MILYREICEYTLKIQYRFIMLRYTLSLRLFMTLTNLWHLVLHLAFVERNKMPFKTFASMWHTPSLIWLRSTNVTSLPVGRRTPQDIPHEHCENLLYSPMRSNLQLDVRIHPPNILSLKISSGRRPQASWRKIPSWCF